MGLFNPIRQSVSVNDYLKHRLEYFFSDALTDSAKLSYEHSSKDFVALQVVPVTLFTDELRALELELFQVAWMRGVPRKFATVYYPFMRSDERAKKIENTLTAYNHAVAELAKETADGFEAFGLVFASRIWPQSRPEGKELFALAQAYRSEFASVYYEMAADLKRFRFK